MKRVAAAWRIRPAREDAAVRFAQLVLCVVALALAPREFMPPLGVRGDEILLGGHAFALSGLGMLGGANLGGRKRPCSWVLPVWRRASRLASCAHARARRIRSTWAPAWTALGGWLIFRAPAAGRPTRKSRAESQGKARRKTRGNATGKAPLGKRHCESAIRSAPERVDGGDSRRRPGSLALPAKAHNVASMTNHFGCEAKSGTEQIRSSFFGDRPGTARHGARNAREMKIICFHFDPNICGPHVRSRAVFRRMAEEGHAVRIVIPAGPGSAEAFYRQGGIHVDRLAIRKPVSPRNRRAFAFYCLALPLGVARTVAYLRRERPDVVHVNGAFDLVPGIAARMAGLPVVWHLIDTAPSRPVARILGRIVSLLATRIIYVATAVGDYYGVDGERAEMIFEPVHTERFAPRDPAGRPKTPTVIGLLANWNPLKGQDRFIEVIRQLTDRGHSVRGRIMGAFNHRQAGYWRPLLARINADGLDAVIERPGFVDDPAAALADVDIMLLTSRSEACPISVLEAMSIGVPQVCFRVGGVDEMLGTDGVGAGPQPACAAGPAGSTVPEGDVTGMVAAVEELLSDRTRYRQQAEAGQARARALFSLETCVARHQAVYEAAVRAKGRLS